MEPYKIVGNLKRFDRRARSAPGQPQAKSPAAEAAAKPPREDLALQAAARSVEGPLRKHWVEQPASPQADPPYRPDDWAAFTARVKDAARFFGAALVGVTRVNPLWLYAEGDGERALGEGVDTAVVMAIEMDYDRIATSPNAKASAATFKGYSQMAFTATCLARFLTELGWRAAPSGNDIALSIPLAIDAGLGEMGRSGSLLTEPFGPRVRLCKVFTDAPLTTDAPIFFGARRRCDKCSACAEACPAGAIPFGEPTASGPTPASNPGVLKWYVDGEACRAFWRRNGSNCSDCIRSCPFNVPPKR